MTTTMETTQAETEHERAELHALIENASLPVVRWATATTRAAVLAYDVPGGLAMLKRENDTSLPSVPPDDDDDDADDDAPAGE